MAAYQAGTKLREGLNYLTDGGFDRFVQGAIESTGGADRFATGMDSASRSAKKLRQDLEDLRNQKNIFEKHGIDGYSDSVEENRRKLQEWALNQKGAKDEAEKFARSIKLSTEQLEEQSKKLVEGLNQFRQANPTIRLPDLAAALKPQIQGILDAYRTLGQQVPPEIRKIASELHISSTAAEKHRQSVVGFLSDVLGFSNKTTEQLREAASVAVEALGHLTPQNTTAEQYARIREELRKLLGEFTNLGRTAPAELQAVAQKFGVVQEVSARAEAAFRQTILAGRENAKQTLESAQAYQQSGVAVGGFVGDLVVLEKNLITGRLELKNIRPALQDAGAEYGRAGQKARDAANWAAGPTISP
jgi:hypothetical protein